MGIGVAIVISFSAIAIGNMLGVGFTTVTNTESLSELFAISVTVNSN